MAKFYFAVYQTYILPMASGALADCKFSVCRRQMKRLPIASVSLADFTPDKRQNLHLPSAIFLPAVRGLFFCQPAAADLQNKTRARTAQPLKSSALPKPLIYDTTN